MAKKALPLPVATDFEYLGVNINVMILKDGESVNLKTVTNKKIERLLSIEGGYWAKHFRKQKSARKETE